MALIHFLGEGAFLGMGKETDYGDEVARDRFFPLAPQGSMSTSQPSTARPALIRGTGGLPQQYVQGRRDVSASSEIELLYEGLGAIWEAAFGSVGTTGSGPYVHTYDLENDLPSYSLELRRGTARGGGSDESDLAFGALLNRITVRGQAGGLVTLRIEWMCQDSDDRQAPSAATYSDGALVEMLHLVAFEWNGQTEDIKSFEFSLDNGYSFRDRSGSRLTARPARGERKASLKIELDYSTDAYFAGLRATTEDDAILTFTNGTSTWVLTLHNARVNTESAGVSGFGVVQNSLEFLPRAVIGGDRGVQLVITNSEASGTAA